MAHPAQVASETQDLEDLHTVADGGAFVGTGVGECVGAGVGNGVGNEVGGSTDGASVAAWNVVVVVQQLSPTYPLPETQHEYWQYFAACQAVFLLQLFSSPYDHVVQSFELDCIYGLPSLVQTVQS